MVFNESKNGFMETKSSDADTKCVQLECLNEESHSESNYEEENQESPQEEDSNTVLRHSPGVSRKPDYFGVRCTVADTSGDPTSLKDTLARSDKTMWVNAMDNEIKSLYMNEVWDLVKLPNDKKAAGSKWIYRTKRSANGTVKRH